MEWLNGALLLFFFSGMGALIWRVKSDLERQIDRTQNGASKEINDIWSAFRGCQSDHRDRMEALRSDMSDLRTEMRVGFAELKAFIKNGGK